jgi:hypothetical protein
VPPIQHGTGPYSALFRATSTEGGYQNSSVSSPTPTLTSSFGGYSGDGGPFMSPSPAPQVAPARATRPPTNIQLKPVTKKKATTSRAKATGKAKASTSTHQTSTLVSASSHDMYDGPLPSTIPTTNRYYRHDYERDMGQDKELSPLDVQTRDRIAKAMSNPELLRSLSQYPPLVSPYPNVSSASSAQERPSGGGASGMWIAHQQSCNSTNSNRRKH